MNHILAQENQPLRINEQSHRARNTRAAVASLTLWLWIGPPRPEPLRIERVAPLETRGAVVVLSYTSEHL